jgi:hypothetical protein
MAGTIKISRLVANCNCVEKHTQFLSVGEVIFNETSVQEVIPDF